MAAAGDVTNSQYFKKGARVEISSDDLGFRGSWYEGTVVRPPRAGKKVLTKVLVEYTTLKEDEKGTRPLREDVDVIQLRPPPPREPAGWKFRFGEEVDAYYSDGWWEGTITEVVQDGERGQYRYAVFFSGTREQITFDASDLRLHREWRHEKWVPPLENSAMEEKVIHVGDEAPAKVEANEKGIERSFSPGEAVEVSNDEEGFEGAWFVATIVEKRKNGKYLIEYGTLKDDDGTTLLREEVDGFHIRPSPPLVEIVDRFGSGDKVDAFYNDGWWTGEVSKALKNDKYSVYFGSSEEVMRFHHTDLRLHQDWTNGGTWETSKRRKLS